MSVRSANFRSSSSHFRRSCSLRISDETSSDISSGFLPSFTNCCVVIGLIFCFISSGGGSGGSNSFSILWSLFLKNSRSVFKHLLVRPKKSV